MPQNGENKVLNANKPGSMLTNRAHARTMFTQYVPGWADAATASYIFLLAIDALLVKEKGRKRAVR